MIHIQCIDKLYVAVISKLSQLLTKMNVNIVKHNNIVSFYFLIMILLVKESWQRQ